MTDYNLASSDAGITCMLILFLYFIISCFFQLYQNLAFLDKKFYVITVTDKKNIWKLQQINLSNRFCGGSIKNAS